jgi:sulfite exporter TauE/SafE
VSAAFVAALAAAAMLGLAGSGHCVAMCGGISGAFGARAKRPAAFAWSHAGRIASYAIAGLACGAAGAGAGWLFESGGFAVVPPILSGLLLVAVGAKLARNGRGIALVDRLGARAWRFVAPLARRHGAGDGAAASFVAGAAWGWLPCGMTYAALVIAAASGGALEGAATMLVFGLGTTPALVAAGALLARVRALQGVRIRRAAGLAVVAIGVAVGASPFLASHGPGAHAHAGHAGHHAAAR